MARLTGIELFETGRRRTVQVSSRIVTYIVTYHRSYQIPGCGGIMAYMIIFSPLLHWSEEEPGCRGFSIAPCHRPLGGSAARIVSYYCLDKSTYQQRERTVLGLDA